MAWRIHEAHNPYKAWFKASRGTQFLVQISEGLGFRDWGLRFKV